MVEESRDGEGRIVRFPMTCRKNTEVLSALFLNCVAVFRVHRPRRERVAQEPHLDWMSDFMAFYHGKLIL